jgi:hypothetical protein
MLVYMDETSYCASKSIQTDHAKAGFTLGFGPKSWKILSGANVASLTLKIVGITYSSYFEIPTFKHGPNLEFQEQGPLRGDLDPKFLEPRP